jgi:hypothetical protein
VIYLPAAAGQLTGNLTKAEVSQSGQVIKSQPVQRQGRYVNEMWFDRGDPSGAWKIEIFVDGNKIATVEFQVVAARSCP